MNLPFSETPTSHNNTFPPFSQRISDYTIVRRLAMSGQAILYLSVKKEQKYALKLYKASGKDIKWFEKEAEILRKVNGRGIVPMQEPIQNIQFVNQHSEKMFYNVIVMPFYENGDLLQWVCKYRPFSERSGQFFFKRLLSAIRFIVDKQVYHRDIKPQNILLDENYQPLILDFGLSCDYHHRYKGFVGSARYAAPQVIKQKEYTVKSQIYSLGILLFFMLTGSLPYTIAKINEKKYSVFWENVEKKTQIKLSSSFKELFLQMAHPDHSKRPDLDEILQFDWLKENEMTRQQYFEYAKSKYLGSTL